MANGMFDLKGWTFQLLSAEEIAQRDEETRRQEAEELERWPLSQRRSRCMNCGCFMPRVVYRYTRCKRCDESYDSLQ